MKHVFKKLNIQGGKSHETHPACRPRRAQAHRSRRDHQGRHHPHRQREGEALHRGSHLGRPRRHGRRPRRRHDREARRQGHHQQVFRHRGQDRRRGVHRRPSVRHPCYC